MRKVYTILRIAAYLAGLGGMALFVTAQHGATSHPSRATTGGVLLIASFLCFLGTYVIYVTLQLKKR